MSLCDNETTVSPPPGLLGETKRKRAGSRKRRTKRVTDLRRLNAKARERHEAWLATQQANVTERLTDELDRGFAELRRDRTSDPLPASWDEVNEGLEGTGLERLPYRGRISRLTRRA